MKFQCFKLSKGKNTKKDNYIEGSVTSICPQA